MNPARIRIGRLGRPAGLKGFVGLYVEPGNLVYFEPGAEVRVGEAAQVVRALRRGRQGHEVQFEAVSDRTAADEIRGCDIFAAERRQLASHEFWPDQLIGLEVRPNGGRVTEVIHGAAQDRLAIERCGQRGEVPFVDELVPVVDVDGGFLLIVEIEGLFDGDIDG